MKNDSMQPDPLVTPRLSSYCEEAEISVSVRLADPDPDLSKRLFTGHEIGAGGTGVICKAFDTNLLRVVAKKSLHNETADVPESRSRLIEEAQITSQLGHPNIVPVHELAMEEDGRLFFTMKLVEGVTLKSILDEKPVEERTKSDLFEHLQVLLKVCDALAFAHSRGVVHRDLKPENIMVGKFGEVYLMDWGLAKLRKGPRPSMRDTVMPMSMMPFSLMHKSEDRKVYDCVDEDGKLRGTIFYMAPEQARGDFESIDERTDIFLLGGMLYKILTHQSPYFGDNVYKLVYEAQQADIPPPETKTNADVPSRLSFICMKALKKDPGERYESVTAFKNDIEAFLQSGWQFNRRVFSPGTAIVKEGEKGNTAYIITKGTCVVYKTIRGSRMVLAGISEGDVFGEVAVFTNEPRSATVEAIDTVIAMEIGREHFEEDLGMSFWLGLFTKALASRYIEKDRRVAELEAALKSR
jgi:serine/threonine protein kinase